jgi:hypothetical protein
VSGVPYGKELASDGKTLVPSERDQKPLARIRRRHLGGMSVRAIAAKVTAESDRSRSGAAVSKSTVGRRLRG